MHSHVASDSGIRMEQPRCQLLLALPTYCICIIALAVAASPLAEQVQAAVTPTALTATYNAPSSPQVLIVGAGMAGITAARHLTDSGISVLVLEARNRPGGRLHSVQTTAGFVDLGAMWIHEAAPGNAVYDLSQQLNINISRQHDYNSASLFDPDGSTANTPLYLATYSSFISQVKGRINTMRAAANASAAAPPKNATQLRLPAEPAAVADLPISDIVAQWMDSHKATWRQQQVPLANLIIHQHFQALLNANITQLSSLRFGDSKTLPNVDVLLQPGYDSLVKRLLPGLPVSYNTTKGTTLQAPYALVTLPLGVLKTGDVTFEPPLPAGKQAAIMQMGMGVLDKLVLVFPPDKVFWNKQVDFLGYARNDWSGRWSSWLNYYKVWGVPVLVAMNTADTARQLEGMTDKEVIGDALKVVRLMYSNSSTAKAVGGVPDPVQAYVTRWAADPYSRGAYSYYATGNSRNIIDILAEPFGRILFAGEAASSKPATVLGALLSGRREAGRVQQLLAVQQQQHSQLSQQEDHEAPPQPPAAVTGR